MPVTILKKPKWGYINSLSLFQRKFQKQAKKNRTLCLRIPMFKRNNSGGGGREGLLYGCFHCCSDPPGDACLGPPQAELDAALYALQPPPTPNSHVSPSLLAISAPSRLGAMCRYVSWALHKVRA